MERNRPGFTNNTATGNDPDGAYRWSPSGSLIHASGKFVVGMHRYPVLVGSGLIDRARQYARKYLHCENVRNHFRQQCRAAVRRSSEEKPVRQPDFARR